jgi:UDP-galactopyranose mutase
MNILIIGGGFAGCSSAEMLSKLHGANITIIEKSNYLGAGVRTFFYGGHPYTFGPRHFLTQNKATYNYLKKFLNLRNCNYHQFKSYVETDDKFYNYPLNEVDIQSMPDNKIIKKELGKLKSISNPQNLEEFWLNSIGKTLFGKVIKNYNKKMWLVDSCKKIDTFKWSPKGATIKKGSRSVYDDRISVYPKNKDGYNAYFDLIDKSKKIKKLYNSNVTKFDFKKKELQINNKKILKYDYVINTVSPDNMFGNTFGELKFIGRDLHLIVLPRKQVFPKNVFFLYYPNTEKFTRLVEYKKFTLHESETSLIGMEIPSKNGRFYPLPFKSEQKKAKKYFDIMPKNFYSIGRAGTYRYEVDIDDCIYQSMLIFDEIKNNNYSGPIVGDEFK